MKHSTHDLRRSIRIVVVLLAASIVLVPPLLSYGLAVSTARSETEVAVRQQAVLLARTIARYPDVWKYAAERLEDTLVGIRAPNDRLVITDADGKTILALGPEPAAPVIVRTHPLEAFGTTVGTVTMTSSLRPAIGTTLRVASGSLLLGFALLISFHRLRRREIDMAEARLTDAVDAAGDFAAVVREAMDAVILIDPEDGRLVDFNDAACSLTQLSRETLLGMTIRELAPGCSAALLAVSTQPGAGDGAHTIETEIANLSGRKLIVRISVRRLRRRDKLYLATIWNDFSELHEQQQQLQSLAHFDSLTQLPNRALLADRMEQALARTRRSGLLLAVAILDLDRFKPINDTFGHHVGDHVLIEIASRLRGALRAEDTVARLGGDEFVIILTAIASVEASQQFLRRIIDAIEAPIPITGHEITVSASIGVTHFPQDAGDAEQLLRHADQAMYQAKIAGRHGVHLFDPAQEQIERGNQQQLQEIRDGLERGEFRLHYQPKVNMRSGRVIGAEALIRWQHPVDGLMLPGRFLAATRDHHLAIELGDWVIDEALRQIAAWNAEGIDLFVSVNAFASQLQAADFVDRLAAHLARQPTVRPEQLEIEIVETEALKNIDEVNEIVSQCQALGVSFSIDDFGTGYSSLSYLRRLSAQTLKIDQSFVRGMLHNAEDRAITEGIVRLAEAFGRKVIAEGVEHPQHGLGLMMIGCEAAQGYGIARPMPGDAIVGWVRSYRAPDLWLHGFKPLSRGDFDLLTAEVDHDIWFAKLSADMLTGEVEVERGGRPTVDALSDPLSRWIGAEGGNRYGHLASFAALARTHAGVAERCRALAATLAAGSHDDARKEFAALGPLHAELRHRFSDLRDARAGEAQPGST